MILQKKSFESLLVHLFVFLLILEWLYPLENFDIIYNSFIFILFLVLCFLLSFFQFRISFNLMVVFLYIVVALNLYFFNKSGLGLLWPDQIVGDIVQNLDFTRQGNWGLLTDSFRTFLMFLLLALLVYVLRYWIIVRKKPFLFFLFTIIYLVILDVFSTYDAKFAIIRSFVFGLSGLGIITFYRLTNREQLYRSRIFKSKVLMFLIFVVFATTSLGMIVPKADSQWANPFSFLDRYGQSTGKGEGGTGNVKVIGYDEDDRFLGGPLLLDDNEVFSVLSPHSQYWRVETKDVYTGKGWETSAEEHFLRFNGADDGLPLYHVEEQYLEQDMYTVFVETNADINHFIYPYGTEKVIVHASPIVEVNDEGGSAKITGFSAGSTRPLYVDPGREKIDLGNGVERYAIMFRRPSYNIDVLRSVTDASGIEQAFLERYTQLPEQLPERIKNLASAITTGQTNWFDKARAIENYLRSYEFTYDTIDVAVPGPEDDYVDQFLFETKRGYCDNFSTAMVVLLRSLGIPARWVKGYTNGMAMNSDISEYQVITITNSHAHSWVEVYFPGVGWVPFEPTKGFLNFGRFHMDIGQSEAQEELSVNQEFELGENEVREPLNEIELEEGPDAISSTEKSGKELPGWFLLFISLLFMVVLLILFFKRKRWIPLLLIVKYRNKTDGSAFEKAYLTLIKRLEKVGLSMDAGDTLRDYARKIDDSFRSKHMSELTHLYERMVYGNGRVKLEKINWQEPWEQLMRKTARL